MGNAYRRRIVGWSIDSRQDTTLVVNALDMAIHTAYPNTAVSSTPTTGTRGGFNRLSQHLVIVEVLDGAASAGGQIVRFVRR